ncbi:MAG TPA: hypothetical protein VE993_12835 [Stellaceae bacterium]|nr:hypothetical protein [Stellaceae bacterium]
MPQTLVFLQFDDRLAQPGPVGRRGGADRQRGELLNYSCSLVRFLFRLDWVVAPAKALKSA